MIKQSEFCLLDFDDDGILNMCLSVRKKEDIKHSIHFYVCPEF